MARIRITLDERGYPTPADAYIRAIHAAIAFVDARQQCGEWTTLGDLARRFRMRLAIVDTLCEDTRAHSDRWLMPDAQCPQQARSTVTVSLV